VNNLTPREKDIAIARGGPATATSLALGELSLYFDTHPRGAPDVRELRLNVRIADLGDYSDPVAAVASFADWLGVEMHCRNGCYIAMRRFTSGDRSVVIEAHYTPDPAAAHFERLAAKEAAERKPGQVPVAA
jgi:hypothetical protein